MLTERFESSNKVLGDGLHVADNIYPCEVCRPRIARLEIQSEIFAVVFVLELAHATSRDGCDLRNDELRPYLVAIVARLTWVCILERWAGDHWWFNLALVSPS